MSVTIKRKSDVNDVIVAELARYGGLCHFCGRPVRNLAWHHVAHKDKTIAKWKGLGKLDDLIAELPRCRPAGKECHDHHHANEKIGPNLPHLVKC